jgi:transcriptional regulator with XRE-family HTH domain
MSSVFSEFLRNFVDFILKTGDNNNMEEEKAIIARFIQLRKEFGPSQEKFGKLLGLSDGSISLMEAGKTIINEKHIKLVSGVLGIREEWFRTGEDPMFKDGNGPDLDTLLEIFRHLSPDGRKMILEYAQLILKNERAMRGEPEEKEEETKDQTGA